MVDRDRIERKDFTIRRRGYDPAEVDAHLAAVAGYVEELPRAARAGGGSAAATASERVRALVEAAEANASALHRHAPRAEPASASSAAGRGAGTGESVGQDAETKPAMLGRLEALQSELTALVDSLRTGGTPDAAGLHALESDLRGARDSGQLGVHPEPPPAIPVPPRIENTNGQLDRAQPQLASEKVQGDALASDLDDARLIALNMALNGAPREETERYLAQNFELPDRRRLVDEVYATMEA